MEVYESNNALKPALGTTNNSLGDDPSRAVQNYKILKQQGSLGHVKARYAVQTMIKTNRFQYATNYATPRC